MAAADESLPFLDQLPSPSSRASTQIGDEDRVDIEKVPYNDGGYRHIVLERTDLFPERSQCAANLGKLWSRLRTYRGWIAFAILATVLGLSITTVTLIRKKTLTSMSSVSNRIPGLEYTPSGTQLTCGSTLDEAIANRCQFDIMTFAYTPPACFDTELATDVLDDDSELAPCRAAGTWPWWRFENHSEPVVQDAEIMTSYENVWTNNIYHRAHCLYLGRLLTRASRRLEAGETEVYVYSKVLEWEHLLHCNKLLNDMDAPESNPAKAVKVVGTCVRLGLGTVPQLVNVYFSPGRKLKCHGAQCLKSSKCISQRRDDVRPD